MVGPIVDERSLVANGIFSPSSWSWCSAPVLAQSQASQPARLPVAQDAAQCDVRLGGCQTSVGSNSPCSFWCHLLVMHLLINRLQRGESGLWAVASRMQFHGRFTGPVDGCRITELGQGMSETSWVAGGAGPPTPSGHELIGHPHQVAHKGWRAGGRGLEGCQWSRFPTRGREDKCSGRT